MRIIPWIPRRSDLRLLSTRCYPSLELRQSARTRTLACPPNGLQVGTVLGASNKGGTTHRFGQFTSSGQREFSGNATDRPIVDLRSDTLTQPTRPMLECVLSAKTGDDVFGEDPTVRELEVYAAELFGKERALYLPTGTMGNLCAIMAHCHERASEIIVGSKSHICLYEGGNAAGLAGVHTRQIPEDPLTATVPLDAIRDAFRKDDDDHHAKTKLVCLENSHNILGGVALPLEYMDSVANLVHDELGGGGNQVKLHVDGARICNAAVSLGHSLRDLCRNTDSVSVCLSKGLGAPLGTVLVGETEFIRLAKRARKRCGGGMRQVGVVASMGLYALQNHVERLADDHRRARKLAEELQGHGFVIARDGEVDTNIVFFSLPHEAETECLVSEDDLCSKMLSEFGISMAGGYGDGGRMFRLVTHMDVDDEGIERACEALVKLCFGR